MMPKRTFSPDLIADVERRTATGQTVRAIARALDVPRSTVAAILRDHPVSTAPMPSTMPTAGTLMAPPRLLLHPWLRTPVPLPDDVAVHPTVRRLYDDAFGADPVRASELDVLTTGFDLGVPLIRAYLNVLSAERVRARFDLVQDEDSIPDALRAGLCPVERESPPETRSARLTLPVGLWRAAYARLRDAFAVQEEEMAAVRTRLLSVLPRDVGSDDL